MFALTKKLVLSCLAGLGLLASLNTAAHAAQETFIYHGVSCEAYSPADAAKLVFNAYGIMNVSSSSAQVFCPIPTRPAQFIAAVNVKGYDRNTAAGLDCELDYLDFNGNAFVSQTGRGSTAGFSQIAPTSFNFTLTPSTAYGMSLRCQIPAQTATGASGITSIHVLGNL